MPKPTESADVTTVRFVNEVPLLVEWKSPPVPPAIQTSPSIPGTALIALSVPAARLGSPVAAVLVKVAPPLVLM